MTITFLEEVSEPIKPVYQVYAHDWHVGELYWDEIGPQYWFRPDTKDGRDLTARDLHAIYSRMVALTLDFGGNPGYRFPGERLE